MKIQNKNIFAIIPSAGTGTRFGTTIPKQYIEIDHEPVIQKTITKFINIEEIKKIFVVLSPNDRDFDNLEISTNQKIVKVEGGDSRAESVLNALKTSQPLTHNLEYILDIRIMRLKHTFVY